MKTIDLNKQIQKMDNDQNSNPTSQVNPLKTGLRKKIILLSCILGLILTSCLVKSLHPFYTVRDIIFRSDIIGSYTDQDKGTWTIEQKTETNGTKQTSDIKTKNYYQLKLVDNKKRTVIFKGVLFKLDNYYYVDFFLESGNNDDGETELYSLHVLGVHTVARVNISKNEISLKWYNQEWLSDLFKQNKIRLAHEKLEDSDDIVLTASTEELQKFMKKFANDPKAFEERDKGGKFEYVLTRNK